MLIEGVGAISKPVSSLSEYRGNGGGDYLYLYYQQLVGQFRTLPDESRQKNAYHEADTIAHPSNVAEITWPDVYRLEMALLKLLPPEDLRRKAWSLRREFAEIAGANRYAAYLSSSPPDAEKGSEAPLRADLEEVLQEIQWLYTVLPVQEHVRSTLAKQTLRVTLAVVGLIVLLVLIYWLLTKIWTNVALQGQTVGPVTIALLMGILGGLISTLRRIQNTPLRDNVVADLIEASTTSVSVFVSPLIGAVFAILLMMMFKGQLISGDLFPKFWSPPSGTAPGPTAFKNLVNELGPEGASNYAKLIVWAFLAGFAERLVPDALSRLADAGQATTKKTP